MTPLAERIGLRPGRPTKPDDENPSVRARMYLVFLCVEGFMQADWEWTLATRKFEIGPFCVTPVWTSRWINCWP